MVLTKHLLAKLYGIDFEIAQFFADRKVPVNNAYWNKRFIYIPRGTGYLFIPLFFDIQYKLGIKKEILLNEEYVQLMESILSSAGKYEFQQISYQQHMAECIELVNGKIHHPALYEIYLTYINNEEKKPYQIFGLEQRALNRADAFLFILFCITTEEEQLKKQLYYWYPLVSSFLLMDDIIDYQADEVNNEENGIKEFGKGKDGFKKAIEFLMNNYRKLETINPTLGLKFTKELEKDLATDYYVSLLK